MGFELEVEASIRQRGGARDLDDRVSLLTRRWTEATERVALAQVTWQTLRGHVLPGDPRLIGAQLKLAQARHRQRELYEEIGRLEEEIESESA